MVPSDLTVSLCVPGNLQYLRNKFNTIKPLEKGWKHVWVPPYDLARMLAGEIPILLTGKNIPDNKKNIGWIEYVYENGIIHSQSIQGFLVSGYQQINLDPSKFNKCLVEFRDHTNPIIQKSWNDFDITDEKRIELSEMYSKRCDFINQIATNMVGVKHNSYTLNDLIEFFESGKSELISRFGENNIAEFIDIGDDKAIKFPFFENYIYY